MTQAIQAMKSVTALALDDILAPASSSRGAQAPWDWEDFCFSVYSALCGPDSNGLGIDLAALLEDVTRARLRELDQREPAEGEVLCALAGRDAAAVVAREVEIARVQAAERILDAARARLRAAEQEFRSALRVSCGVNLDDEEGEVVLNQKNGEVLCVDRRNALAKLLDAVRGRIDGDPADLPGGAGDFVPVFQKDLDVVIESADKEELLKLVDDLRRDKDFAASVSSNEDTPKPIRLIADVSSAVTHVDLPQAPRAMGFGAAARNAG